MHCTVTSEQALPRGVACPEQFFGELMEQVLALMSAHSACVGRQSVQEGA